MFDRGGIALAEKPAQVHLGAVEGLPGVEDGDALAGDIGFGLQLFKHRGIAERTLGANQCEQRFGGAQAGFTQGDEGAGTGERPVGDLGIAD